MTLDVLWYYGNRDSELAGPGTPDVRRRDGDAVGPAAARRRRDGGTLARHHCVTT